MLRANPFDRDQSSPYVLRQWNSWNYFKLAETYLSWRAQSIYYSLLELHDQDFSLPSQVPFSTCQFQKIVDFLLPIFPWINISFVILKKLSAILMTAIFLPYFSMFFIPLPLFNIELFMGLGNVSVQFTNFNFMVLDVCITLLQISIEAKNFILKFLLLQ